MAAGTDVRTKANNGVTPLHSVVFNGHVGCASQLSAAGAEVTLTTWAHNPQQKSILGQSPIPLKGSRDLGTTAMWLGGSFVMRGSQ